MLRFNKAWTITAIVLLSPTLMLASDKETSQRIANALDQSGRLVGYRFGVSYKDGTAVLKGRVSSEEQRALAVSMTERMPEVSKVVDELRVENPPNSAGPVLRAVNSPAREPASPEHTEAAPRLETQQPVVYAAKTPRGIGSGLLRMARPTVDPNVQTAAGELSFPGSEANSENAQPEQPAVVPVSARRSIIRRRTVSSSQTPTPAPMPAAAPIPSAPKMSNSANAPLTANIQGRQMKLIPLVRGPDGNLVPLDPSMAQQMNVAPRPVVASQPTHVVPAKRAVLSSSKQTRRGRPIPIASRNQVRSVPAGYNTAAGQPTVEGAYPPGAFPVQGGVPGAPLPAAVPSPVAGPAPAYYDQPAVPNYAWPSYAAYPNYAALTYPKQYSPTAWPYIGPFYPYPQVPLGWRKVTLEWDDGWWFLDFDDRNCQ